MRLPFAFRIKFIRQIGFCANVAGDLALGSEGDSDACGSPGEVANVPELGHQYYFHLEKEHKYNQNELDFSKYDRRETKVAVWANTQLKAQVCTARDGTLPLPSSICAALGQGEANLTKACCTNNEKMAAEFVRTPAATFGTTTLRLIPALSPLWWVWAIHHARSSWKDWRTSTQASDAGPAKSVPRGRSHTIRALEQQGRLLPSSRAQEAATVAVELQV